MKRVRTYVAHTPSKGISEEVVAAEDATAGRRLLLRPVKWDDPPHLSAPPQHSSEARADTGVRANETAPAEVTAAAATAASDAKRRVDSSGEKPPATDKEEAATSSAGGDSPEDFGLPAGVCQRYRANGMTKLYPWQSECLASEGVLDGRSLVYCAPTSGGKTLVAEILMLRKTMLQSKKALFVVPFVSVAAEKTSGLTALLGQSCKVQGFYGGVGEINDLENTDIAVCTIEKANGERHASGLTCDSM